MNANELDQQIGSILEAWINRDVDDDQCRFCNERLNGPSPPEDRYCDEDCQKAMDQVFDARITIGKRDLQQRGYD